jgi:hypothetical protein
MGSGGGVRDAVLRIRADDSDLDRALGSSKSKLQAWSKSVGGSIKKSISGAFDGLSNLVGFTGVAGLALAARSALELDRRYTALRISANLTASQQAKLADQINTVAAASGVQQDQLLAGAEKYQAITGHLEQYTAAMGDFADIQRATGASMSDLIGVATALTGNLGIDPSQLKDVFGMFADQGKQGSVEFGQIASLFPTLLAMSAEFGDSTETGAERAREIGAAMQMVTGKTHDAAMAGTLLTDTMESIKKSAGKLRAHGIEVWTDSTHTKMRDLFELFDEFRTKIRPDQQLKIFGGRKEVDMFLTFLREGDAEMKKFYSTGAGAADITRDAATATNSLAGQWDRVRAQVAKTLNDLIVPNLPKLVEGFKAIAKIVDVLLKHPMLSLAGWGALKFGPGIAQLFAAGGRPGAGGLATVMGATPVYVVGMAEGVALGAGAGGPAGARSGPGSSAGRNFFAGAASVVTGFGGAVVGAEAGKRIDKALGGDGTIGSAMGGAAGGVGGAAGGAWLVQRFGARLLPFVGPYAAAAYGMYDLAKHPEGKTAGSASSETGAGYSTSQLVRSMLGDANGPMPGVAWRELHARGDVFGRTAIPLGQAMNFGTLFGGDVALRMQSERGQQSVQTAEAMVRKLLGPLATRQQEVKVVIEMRNGNLVALIDDDRSHRRRP